VICHEGWMTIDEEVVDRAERRSFFLGYGGSG
jgi:hypothetical protein